MLEAIIKRGTQDPGKVKKRVSVVLIPTLMEGMKGLYGFPKDLEIILDAKRLSVSALARSVGVARSTVSRWRSGRYIPREPLTLASLKLWARRIREEGGNNHG